MCWTSRPSTDPTCRLQQAPQNIILFHTLAQAAFLAWALLSPLTAGQQPVAYCERCRCGCHPCSLHLLTPGHGAQPQQRVQPATWSSSMASSPPRRPTRTIQNASGRVRAAIAPPPPPNPTLGCAMI